MIPSPVYSEMSEKQAHILDLPNEMLFRILNNLENIDVLYFLLSINNRRLQSIGREKIFSSTLKFVSISRSSDEICSISEFMLDRFCTSILPRIKENIKSLTCESASIERIFRASIYPNLTELRLYNFNQAIVSRYFTDDSFFERIYKQQMTEFFLISNENNIEITAKEYTKNVCALIFMFFENLKHLSIVPSSVNDYPPLSLHTSIPPSFSSSTLMKLCIDVNDFDDCLALLDGRFKQLTTFIVRINYIYNWISRSYKMDDLLNLKCFSLICYDSTSGYEDLILPLLRRMSCLEELTLYVHILGGSPFISGIHLANEILIRMPRLHTFTFYFASENDVADPSIRISNSDIEETFTNMEDRKMACMVDYCRTKKLICRVFSLPFNFDRLADITNNLPNLIFSSVTHLILRDKYPFKYEFFIRLVRSFPFLKKLSIHTILAPNWRIHEFHLRDKDWCSIVEYPHLISLDINSANSYYAEHFLNETKTNLPCLTELKVRYEDLEMVTENFTRNQTQRNCAKVKRLIAKHRTGYPNDVYLYFPSLSL